MSAESEFHAGIKGGSPRKKNMMIDLVRMLHGVYLMRASYVCISRTFVQHAGTRSDLRTWILVSFCVLITRMCDNRLETYGWFSVDGPWIPSCASQFIVNQFESQTDSLFVS